MADTATQTSQNAHSLATTADDVRVFANAVGRELSVLQSMMIAFKLAAEADTYVESALYWPHLMEALIEKLQKIDPVEVGLNDIAKRIISMTTDRPVAASAKAR